jgi:serine/threonine-protein kinase HipA
MAPHIRRVNAANVFLWGAKAGAVAWDDQRNIASFEYAPAFLRGGFDLSPLVLPRRPGIFSFPALNRDTYHGLPGLLSDSLPDRFGNALIDLWLARQGRALNDFSPVERLCYIGSRGMGALEFKPALVRESGTSAPIEIAELTDIAQRVLDQRRSLLANLGDREKAMATIIKIGTSAGGARAKALIAWNPDTNEVRTGQVMPPPGFQSWILKFDGVRDNLLGESEMYGRIELAYHRMAVASGIEMTECRLYEEGGRAHFMTRRFDRDPGNRKIHMHSLCGLAHYDFNAAGAYGYEQAFSVVQQLRLGYPALAEMFRRMVFNIVARNQDDHTRNIAFLMDEQGQWRLAPAFDVMWAYNTSGPWTNQHQMSVGGKRDGFMRADLVKTATDFGMRRPGEIIDTVIGSVRQWPEIAAGLHIPNSRIAAVASTHRLGL